MSSDGSSSSLGDSPAVGADVSLSEFPQQHEEVVLARTWWWAVHISLSVLALVANLVFIVTVIYNR